MLIINLIQSVLFFLIPSFPHVIRRLKRVSNAVLL